MWHMPPAAQVLPCPALCLPLAHLLAGSGALAWQQFVTIDGTDYDVTTFVKQHPGGGVIRSYLRKDATAAFKEFHR